MLRRILSTINDIFLRMVDSLKRFPEPLALAFAIVMILIFMNHTHPIEDTLAHVALVLALGIPLTLCIKMFLERSPVQKVIQGILYVLVAVILILYYNFLLPEMDMVSMTRYIGLSLALYLLFMVIPYLGRRDGFELYVIKLFTGFIVTYFYSLILFLGLVAIIFTINTLFSAGIPEKVYFDLFLIVAGIFAPAYFLAGVPKEGAKFKEEDYPKFLKILLLYIVLPLLSIYTAILYVYFIKIIVTRFWPAGIVSHLVLWYSFISIVAIFFSYILKDKSAWVRSFIRFFPKLILPLLIMMFVAMGIRINAYGVTENRYWVLAGGFWATISMLYLAFKKDSRNIKIVVSLAIIAALTVVGPWSAYAISKHSQNNRIEKLLTENNMLVNGEIVPSQTISQADKVSISSIVQFFNNKHDLSELKVVPRDFALNQMEEVFGFNLTYSSMTQYFGHHLKDEGGLLDIRDYDYYLSSLYPLDNGQILNQEDLSIAYNRESFTLIIKKAEKIIYEKNIGEIALKIHENHIGESSLESKDMNFQDENEHLKMNLYFKNISGRESSGSGEPEVEWMDFSILLRIQE